MSFSANTHTANSEINVTPLIDVLLVLLIIFMVITPLKQQGLKAVVPQPPQAHTADEPPPATIVLQVQSGAGGVPAYTINQQPVAKDALASRLRQIYATRADRQMFLKGDASLSYATVAEASAWRTRRRCLTSQS